MVKQIPPHGDGQTMVAEGPITRGQGMFDNGALGLWGWWRLAKTDQLSDFSGSLSG